MRHTQLACLRAAGFELIRIRAKDKAPQDTGWRKLSLSYDEVAAHVKNGGNAGWRLGPTDLVIDVDPRNFAADDDPVKRLCYDASLDLSACPHVMTGSGGDHYYFTKPSDWPVMDTLPEYSGIEFKTVGRQVVVPGSIHPSGNLYYWDDFAPSPSERPPTPDGLLELIRRPELIVTTGGGELSPEQLEALLIQLDPTHYQEHDRWLALMMACHHGTQGEGRAEFISWSVNDPEFRDHRGSIGRRWDSLHSDKHTGVTYRTLYREVLNAGGTIPTDSPESDFGDDPLGGEPEQGLRPDRVRLLEMNDKHCVVYDGSLKVFTKEFDPLLKRYYYTRYTKRDFEMWYMNKEVEVAGSLASKATWWLRHPQRREYKGLIFAPNDDVEGYLNLWQGFSVKPGRGQWDKFDELIRDVICSGDVESYEYCLNWLAHLIQRPGEPAEVAFVLRGEKGTGKGTFATTIMEMVKSHTIQVSSAHHFTGRFNAHLRDCVFLFVDEAFWAGDHASEGTLKRLITEPTLVYEGKGVNAQVGKNCISVMVASNSDWVIPAGLDSERRYAMMDVSDHRIGQDSWFEAIRKQMFEYGGLSGFFRFLQERDIKGWHPRKSVPQTAALAEQKLEGLNDVQEWWYSRLLEGRLPGQRGEWDVLQRGEAPMVTMHDHYLAETTGLNRRNRRASQTAFGRQLKKLVPNYSNMQMQVEDQELIVGDARGRIRIFACGTLPQCREVFEKKSGIKIESEPDIFS